MQAHTVVPRGTAAALPGLMTEGVWETTGAQRSGDPARARKKSTRIASHRARSTLSYRR
jgi:hypothetical protein